MWRGFFMKIHPKNSRQLVFFIPFLFTFGIILGGIVSLFSRFILNSYLVIWAFYLIYLTSLGIRTKNIKLAVPVIFVTILTHFAYGFGFFRGIISGSEGPIKKGMHSKENLI